MARTLGGVGIWSHELEYGDAGKIADAIRELEELGYSAAWIPDVGASDLFGAIDRLLDETSTMTIATGILNVWFHEPGDVMQWWKGLADDRRQRTLIGLGVSHGPLIGDRWARPLAVMKEYLDGLDAGEFPVEARCLAALGPKMLELAGARSAGAHPYLVTPEHTARARQILGDGLLAVEQGVVLDTDTERARGIARQTVTGYSALPNYARNWRQLGFTAADVEGPSDRLVDALVVCGDVDAIATRVNAHREAGADHVCIQVLSEPGSPMNRDAWRELAPALTG